ncbi:hypothetical protein [Marinitenerispora sediminis]|uniref:Uncharacterized protein n=1 Tax=Marinitenerispora sediminis TaxID=1931232 RepID=A0A368T6I9_9ACTN|nr:hypothetical protein [Marinitenerispora sediminis]RCV53489.1 hypothetical protein DEF23_17575 [Marinitenerispora sediminis]RCV59317.1 hypothetical protein DEF24_10115 [Marinitenerispora sediminis]
MTAGDWNCVCGRPLGDRLHTEAAPGVPVPESMRDGEAPDADDLRARIAEALYVAPAEPTDAGERVARRTAGHDADAVMAVVGPELERLRVYLDHATHFVWQRLAETVPAEELGRIVRTQLMTRDTDTTKEKN